MRLFVANVSANEQTARSGLRSPIFEDGCFELVPIPEETEASTPTYGELLAATKQGTLADFLPPRFRTMRAHADPDFSTCVYGDNVSREVQKNGATVVRPINRASSLLTAQAGDELWFLARLWRQPSVSAQYFVGRLVLEAPPIVLPLGETALDAHPRSVAERIRSNANYRRLIVGTREAAIFVLGDQSMSHRFPTAVEVTPEVAGLVYGADTHDAAIDRYYRSGVELRNKTEPSPRSFRTFQSVTRSIQPFLQSGSDDECIARLHARIPRKRTAPGQAELK